MGFDHEDCGHEYSYYTALSDGVYVKVEPLPFSELPDEIMEDMFDEALYN